MTVLNLTTGEDVDILFNRTWTTDKSLFNWQKDGVNISSGIKYKGANTDTLTILNAQTSDEGTYTLVTWVTGYQNMTSFQIYILIGKYNTHYNLVKKYLTFHALHLLQLMLVSQLSLQQNQILEFILS